MIPEAKAAELKGALPFWMSIVLFPLVLLAAANGGWWLLAPPAYGLVLTSVLDRATGLNLENPDPETGEDQLVWYRLLTLVWVPIQLATQFGLLWWLTTQSGLATWEKVAVFYGVGLMSGAIGITYAHELMHQQNRLERWAGDILMASVLYGHFRSEHLIVHHRHVGTPRDAVTARYNEGFHRFFPRVLRECWHSAFAAERERLARKGLPWWHRSNPFWTYWALQGGMLLAALLIGGGLGLILFLFQAGIAIWYLEITNYVEHYGLTRKHIGEGKYEHVQPRHSWNAAHRVSNWLLINLQRHSDHHYKPARRFPLLQNYSEADAPQLPYGYPLMTALAMIPPLWRRVMNPKVRKWRKMYYPEITDWTPYSRAATPLPR